MSHLVYIDNFCYEEVLGKVIGNRDSWKRENLKNNMDPRYLILSRYTYPAWFFEVADLSSITCKEARIRRVEQNSRNISSWSNIADRDYCKKHAQSLTERLHLITSELSVHITEFSQTLRGTRLRPALRTVAMTNESEYEIKWINNSIYKNNPLLKERARDAVNDVIGELKKCVRKQCSQIVLAEIR